MTMWTWRRWSLYLLAAVLASAGVTAEARADLAPALTVAGGAGVAVEAEREGDVAAGFGWQAGLAGEVVVGATPGGRARARVGARLDAFGAPSPSGPLAGVALQAIVRGQARVGDAAWLSVELGGGGGVLRDPIGARWRGALAVDVGAGVAREIAGHELAVMLRVNTLVAGLGAEWFVVFPLPSADRALVSVTLGPELTW
jgi:hypothetical protein